MNSNDKRKDIYMTLKHIANVGRLTSRSKHLEVFVVSSYEIFIESIWSRYWMFVHPETCYKYLIKGFMIIRCVITTIAVSMVVS